MYFDLGKILNAELLLVFSGFGEAAAGHCLFCLLGERKSFTSSSLHSLVLFVEQRVMGKGNKMGKACAPHTLVKLLQCFQRFRKCGNRWRWAKAKGTGYWDYALWAPSARVLCLGVTALSLTLPTHTYLAGEIPWSRRWFTQGEAQPLHTGCADPCEFPKCGNLDCIISGSGGLRSRSPLIKCWKQNKKKLKESFKLQMHAHMFSPQPQSGRGWGRGS